MVFKETLTLPSRLHIFLILETKYNKGGGLAVKEWMIERQEQSFLPKGSPFSKSHWILASTPSSSSSLLISSTPELQSFIFSKLSIRDCEGKTGQMAGWSIFSRYEAFNLTEDLQYCSASFVIESVTLLVPRPPLKASSINCVTSFPEP